MASDALAAFLRAQWDKIEPDDFHDLTQCDLVGSVVLGSCTCQVPELVRRDIDAKRRILDAHAIVHRGIGWLEDGDEENAEISVCRSCVPKHSWYERRADVPEGPCRAVRLLALPYADVDGYREEWKP